MSSMLADVINAGTGNRARQLGFTLPAAGKTGTTNDYNDAWFVGFTPNIVAGVWVGFDQPKTIIAGGYAAELAVPIWAEFMKRATRGQKGDWFDRPSDVTTLNVCRMSGKLPAGGCDSVQVVNRDGLLERRSMIYTEYFGTRHAARYDVSIHSSPSFAERLAGIFGKEIGTAVSVDHPGLPPPPTSTSGTPANPTVVSSEAANKSEKVEEPKKKRGFWSKVFGVGGDKKNDKKDEERKKEEERRKLEQKQKGG